MFKQSNLITLNPRLTNKVVKQTNAVGHCYPLRVENILRVRTRTSKIFSARVG